MTNIKFNVAQLLRESVGSRREYTFVEDRLPIDDALVLRDIEGTVRFTRTASGVFAHVFAHGLVHLVCVRSLEEFDQPVSVDFEDQFHSVIDVVTGIDLPKPLEDDPFLLDDTHKADIGEAIREYTLLALPLNPVSEAYRDHPVSYTVQSEGVDSEDSSGEYIDSRLEVLKSWTQRQNNQTDT